MSNNFSRFKRDSSNLISEALLNVDDSIKSGSAPGHWPEECPLREGCEHVKPKKSRAKASCHLGMAAVLVLFLSVGLCGDVGSYFPGEVRKSGETSGGQGIYQDIFTGDRFVHPRGDSTGAVLLTEIDIAGGHFDSAIRWSVGDGCDWSVRYSNSSDSLQVEKSVECSDSAMSAEIQDFILSGESFSLEKQILNSGIPFYSKEVIVINEVPFVMQKWEVRTPRGVIGFWYGEPSH